MKSIAYAYCLNNPVIATDPAGMVPMITNHGHWGKGHEFIVDRKDEASVYDGETSWDIWDSYTVALQPTDAAAAASVKAGINEGDAGKAEDLSSADPQEPAPVATQSATLSDVPNCHMCFGQIPTTVVVDQMNTPGARIRNVNGTDSLVVGVDLRVTFFRSKRRSCARNCK